MLVKVSCRHIFVFSCRNANKSSSIPCNFLNMHRSRIQIFQTAEWWNYAKYSFWHAKKRPNSGRYVYREVRVAASIAWIAQGAVLTAAPWRCPRPGCVTGGRSVVWRCSYRGPSAAAGWGCRPAPPWCCPSRRPRRSGVGRSVGRSGSVCSAAVPLEPPAPAAVASGDCSAGDRNGASWCWWRERREPEVAAAVAEGRLRLWWWR